MHAQRQLLQMIVVVVLSHFTGVACGVSTAHEIVAADEDPVSDELKGYGRKPTGLEPLYPEGVPVPRLTSLYGSWTDVDGSMRDEAHSGVDGGDLGDMILSPARATVVASWIADWGWGEEGALLLLHTRSDLNLTRGAPFYYSAFYHLNADDVSGLREGDVVERGQVFARVWRPGGKRRYLPEVHWEVYEVDDPEVLYWVTNEHGYPAWDNDTSELIDPLYLMRPARPTGNRQQVPIVPFDAGRKGALYSGFTYILAPSPDRKVKR
jgi:hypothetical protein